MTNLSCCNPENLFQCLMAVDGLWSPLFIKRNRRDFEDACLRRNPHHKVRDIIAHIEGIGYDRDLGPRRKKKLNQRTTAHFNITADELKMCKLIASLFYAGTSFYRANRPVNEGEPPIKVVVDENMSYKIGIDLMGHGLNVTHVYFEDLKGHPDKDIWMNDADIIITCDDDFIEIAEAMYMRSVLRSGTRHVNTRPFPLIIYADQKKVSKGAFLQAFKRLLPEIIEEAKADTRSYLYGIFQRSGALEFTPHAVVFDKLTIGKEDRRFKRLCTKAVRENGKKHLLRRIDGENFLFLHDQLDHIRAVANKAGFTRKQFNKCVKRHVSQHVKPRQALQKSYATAGRSRVLIRPEKALSHRAA